MSTMTKFQRLLLFLALVASRLPTVCAQPVAANPNIPPSIVINGTVFDPSGAPAAGVMVDVLSVYSRMRPPAITDTNGKYWLDWMSFPTTASYSMVTESVIARDIQRNLVATHLIGEESSHADLHLQPGLTISFKVEDPAGNPVTNAEATLVISFANGRLSIVNQAVRSSSAERNRIEFTALPQGHHYTGYVQAADYNAALPIPAETHTNWIDLGIIILKTNNHKIAGRVLRPDGKAAGTVMIVMTGEKLQHPVYVPTEDDGSFALDDCAGPITLTALTMHNVPGARRLAGTVETISGETNVEIKMAPVDDDPALNTPTPDNPIILKKPPGG
jgi:hypothetical protein